MRLFFAIMLWGFSFCHSFLLQASDFAQPTKWPLRSRVNTSTSISYTQDVDDPIETSIAEEAEEESVSEPKKKPGHKKKQVQAKKTNTPSPKPLVSNNNTNNNYQGSDDTQDDEIEVVYIGKNNQVEETKFCQWPDCPMQEKPFTPQILIQHFIYSHLDDAKISSEKFQCKTPNCPKKDSEYDRGALLQHFKSKHGGMRFKCPDCQALYMRKFELSAHRLRHKITIESSPDDEAIYQYDLHTSNDDVVYVDQDGNVIDQQCCNWQDCLHKESMPNAQAIAHIDDHIGKIGGVQPYCKFDKCFLRYDNKWALKAHLIIDHLGKRYQCSNCKELFKTKKLFDTHKTTCQKANKKQKGRKRKSEQEPGDARPKKKSKINQADLDDSAKNGCLTAEEIQRRREKCLWQGCTAKVKINDRKAHLDNHVETCDKTPDKKFPCRFGNCNHNLESRGRLRTHRDNNHAHAGNNYDSETGDEAVDEENVAFCLWADCKLAQYPFSPQGLKNHLEEHQHAPDREDKEFVCRYEQCHQKFINRPSFLRHFKSQHLKISFECPDCSRKFTLNDNLKRHIENAHHPERENHVCDVCGDKFMTDDALMRHNEAKHEKLRQYKCDYPECTSDFATPQALSQHKRLIHKKSKNAKL